MRVNRQHAHNRFMFGRKLERSYSFFMVYNNNNNNFFIISVIIPVRNDDRSRSIIIITRNSAYIYKKLNSISYFKIYSIVNRPRIWYTCDKLCFTLLHTKRFFLIIFSLVYTIKTVVLYRLTSYANVYLISAIRPLFVLCKFLGCRFPAPTSIL